MLPANQQCNEPLTPAQIAVVLENISSRQKEIQFTKNVAYQEGVKSAANAAAITHLEPAISRAKLAIAAQKEVLTDLRTMRSKLQEINAVVGPNWTENSQSKELCENAMTRADGQIKSGVDKLNGQILQMEEYIPALHAALYEMELDIYSHRLMRDASIQHISSVESHQKSIEENIKLLKFGVKPIKNTPAEIWAKIVSLRVYEDMETYFSNPVGQLVPSAALKLSHVCRLWRRVIFAERQLWQFMAIYQDNWWLPSKLELLKLLFSSYSGAPTLVYDVTQVRNWTGTAPAGYNRHYSRYTTTIGTDVVSMIDAYSVRLLAYGQYDQLSPASISFRQPRCLKMQLLNPPNPQCVLLLNQFTAFTRLELITQHNWPVIPLELSTTHPQLTHLKLDLTTFQTFDLTGYLGLNLTELHVTHNGANTFAPLAATVRLPKLKVLGITPPDTGFTLSLQLPGVTKVILYGPKLSNIGAVSLEQFTRTQFFRKVRELELRNWRLSQPGGGVEPWDVMSVLNEVVESMRDVTILRCIDSHIDGPRLIAFVEELKDTANTLGSLLESVVLNCCSGVTRDECEAIGGLVSKMEVYV